MCHELIELVASPRNIFSKDMAGGGGEARIWHLAIYLGP